MRDGREGLQRAEAGRQRATPTWTFMGFTRETFVLDAATARRFPTSNATIQQTHFLNCRERVIAGERAVPAWEGGEAVMGG
jgi:hypothetical protein